MKILYVITKSNWGGAQRHVYDLAVSMKEKGHAAVVVLGGNGILQKKLEDAGIKTHPISRLGRDLSISKDGGSFRDIFAIMKREKPDVLHLHSPKAAGLGALAGRILGTRQIIFTVHGWTFNENRLMLQKVAIAFFSWITMLLSKRIVLISEREYAQTLHFPLIKDKLSFIPLGIKQPVFMSIDGARQVISKATGIELAELNKKIVVGTIAELHPNKGLFYLVNAMEQVVREHDNALAIIVGDGQEKELLAELITRKKLQNHIKLLGHLDEAAHYLKAFNIFVLPSVKEGLPYTLIEAGFASLPVVATTVGGVPEIVEDMKSGVLVQSKNSRELAHAISFMIEHPHMRRQYGAALRESVMQKFLLEKMVTSVEELYK